MQTMYYTTRNFIRHTDNIVDLTEYRRRLAQVREEQESVCTPEQSAPATGIPALLRALTLDGAASLCVVVMTLTFTLRVLFA